MAAVRQGGGAAPLAAVALIAADGLVSLAFTPVPILSACTLLFAPGLALLPFLPRQLASPALRLALLPVLGGAAGSVAIITVSSVGISLTAINLRLTLLAVALASIAACGVFGAGKTRQESLFRLRAGEGATLAFLGAALAVGAALQALVVGGKPLPGQDWGHYLLYVDEIRRQHSLLIDNPYWMLGGRQFAEDPGVPSLYAAYSLLSGEEVATLVSGIWLVAALPILSVFVFVTALWGRTAGLIAAALYAVVPMNLDMLAWHGLANLWALALLPLVLLAAGMALRGETDRSWSGFLGLSLVALAAAHRLTFLVAALTLALCLAVGLWHRRRESIRFAAATVVTGAVLGVGVIVDLALRYASSGGVQSYRAFLVTKIDWEYVGRDLTTLLGVLGAVALAAILVARPLRNDGARIVLFALLGAVLLLGYAWVVHVPVAYNRAAFYLPLVLAPAVGIAWARIAPRLVVGAAVVVLLVGLDARGLVSDFRAFYGYVNRGSLTGLGYVKTLAKPGDVVVTDTCWGFLATWLLREPILAAQDRSLILPGAEVAPANTARQILYDRKAGAQVARRLSVRYALVDPQCTHETGRPVAPPDIGTPVYASTRLVVLDLHDPTTEGGGGVR